MKYLHNLPLYCLTGAMALLASGITSLKAGEGGILSQAEAAFHKTDYAGALALIKPLAEEGHAEAQYQMGWMYHNGYGLEIDDAQAEYWWLSSAEQGNTDAQLALVLLYREGGKGVPRHLGKASEYLLLAASSGDEEAGQLLSHYAKDPEWHLEARLNKLIRTRPDVYGEMVKARNSTVVLRTRPEGQAESSYTLEKGEPMLLLARHDKWSHVIHLRSWQVLWVQTDQLEPAR